MLMVLVIVIPVSLPSASASVVHRLEDSLEHEDVSLNNATMTLSLGSHLAINVDYATTGWIDDIVAIAGVGGRINLIGPSSTYDLDLEARWRRTLVPGGSGQDEPIPDGLDAFLYTMVRDANPYASAALACTTQGDDRDCLFSLIHESTQDELKSDTAHYVWENGVLAESVIDTGIDVEGNPFAYDYADWEYANQPECEEVDHRDYIWVPGSVWPGSAETQPHRGPPLDAWPAGMVPAEKIVPCTWSSIAPTALAFGSAPTRTIPLLRVLVVIAPDVNATVFDEEGMSKYNAALTMNAVAGWMYNYVGIEMEYSLEYYKHPHFDFTSVSHVYDCVPTSYSGWPSHSPTTNSDELVGKFRSQIRQTSKHPQSPNIEMLKETTYYDAFVFGFSTVDYPVPPGGNIGCAYYDAAAWGSGYGIEHSPAYVRTPMKNIHVHLGGFAYSYASEVAIHELLHPLVRNQCLLGVMTKEAKCYGFPLGPRGLHERSIEDCATTGLESIGSGGWRHPRCWKAYGYGISPLNRQHVSGSVRYLPIQRTVMLSTGSLPNYHDGLATVQFFWDMTRGPYDAHRSTPLTSIQHYMMERVGFPWGLMPGGERSCTGTINELFLASRSRFPHQSTYANVDLNWGYHRAVTHDLNGQTTALPYDCAANSSDRWEAAYETGGVTAYCHLAIRANNHCWNNPLTGWTTYLSGWDSSKGRFTTHRHHQAVTYHRAEDVHVWPTVCVLYS